MQHKPKAELNMHADLQMKIRLQLFCSIITIIIFSTAISLRRVWLSQLFSFQMQSMRRIHFGWLFTTRNASNEEKKKNQDNCSWPSWRGILQSCKTKAASSEEWMNDAMDWLKAATSIVGEHIFRKYIPFTQRRNLKILGHAERKKKNDFELLRKFLLLRREENLVTNVEKKSDPF